MPEIPYDRLQAFTTIVIKYAGSGDEGFVDEIYPEEGEGPGIDHDLERDLEQVAYDILEDRYPGWEINEGSQGTITIHVPERKTVLHHGERIESVKYLPEEEV